MRRKREALKRKTAFSLLFSILSISRRKAPFVLHLLSLNLWRGREPGCAPRRQCHWALQPKKQAAFPTSAPRTISQGSIIFALYVLPPSWLLGQFSSSSFSLLPSLGLCKTRQLYACLSPSPTRSLPHSLSRSLSPLSLPIAAFLGLIPISQLCAACFPPSSSRSSVLSLSPSRPISTTFLQYPLLRTKIRLLSQTGGELLPPCSSSWSQK